MNTTKQNKSISARKRYRRMFFYLIEKHMQKFRHFWRKKNFTWKSHLRLSCTKPFNCLEWKAFYGKDELKSTLSKSYFFGDVRPQFVLSKQDGVLHVIEHTSMSFKREKLFAALQRLLEICEQRNNNISILFNFIPCIVYDQDNSWHVHHQEIKKSSF